MTTQWWVALTVGVSLANLGCGKTCACELGGSGVLSFATDQDAGSAAVAFVDGGAALDLGSAATGHSTGAVLYLVNVGALPLQVLSVGAPTDAEFSAVTAPLVGMVVDPGATGATTMSVIFTPSSPGTKAATVTFQTDSETIPTVTLALTGTGTN